MKTIPRAKKKPSHIWLKKAIINNPSEMNATDSNAFSTTLLTLDSLSA